MRSLSHWGLFQCEHNRGTDRVQVEWGDTLITKYTCRECGVSWAMGMPLVEREAHFHPGGITWVDA